LQVYGWGRGEHGRLGFGDDKSSKMVPQMVQLLVGEDIVQVLMYITTNAYQDIIFVKN
jgi:alpha-tubulin suppressor-like RCC1 family protein